MPFPVRGLAFAALSVAAGAVACEARHDAPTTAVVPVGSDATKPADGAPTPPSSAAPAASAPAPAASPSSPATPPPPPPPGVVVTNETIVVGEDTRAYVLVAPSTYDPARAYPLVLALHGDGGDGASLRAALRLDDATGQDAFVVYPTGRAASWDLYTPVAQNKDVPFLTELVGALSARFTIDATRVFATGFSSGAFMANQLACRRPLLLRGIASHGGGAPNEPQDPTAGTWEGGFVKCADQTTGVAALVVHGEADGIVAWESGNHTATYWARVNGCTSERSPALPAPCKQHNGCPGDKPVVFCAIAGLDHTLWDNAALATWSFFARL